MCYLLIMTNMNQLWNKNLYLNTDNIFKFEYCFKILLKSNSNNNYCL